LYDRYDATCKRFDPDASSLYDFSAKPKNDRYLYDLLIDRVAHEKSERGFIELATYEGILYWKLYSQPAALKNVCSRIREDTAIQRAIQRTLQTVGECLPQTVPQKIEEVSQVYQIVQNHSKDLYGLSNSCALPARSTFLHFLYPDTVPIFDKQVLLAVGVTNKDANKKKDVLFDYIPFAWQISRNSDVPVDWQETPLRLLDMALWVIRDKQDRLNKSFHRIAQKSGSR
jgi:hypothetical protein